MTRSAGQAAPRRTPARERRLALIGCGRIGAEIVSVCKTRGLPGWTLAGVLVQHPRSNAEVCFTTDPDLLWRSRPDLIVECAGPLALATLGPTALSVADVWTISASALADPRLLADLEARAQESGHRLRVLAGAIAGLDGLATLNAGGEMRLDLRVDLPPGPDAPATLFAGSVREAAQRYPDGVNVAVAAAMAGPGLDASQITVRTPGPVSRHAIRFTASGRTGRLQISTEPDLTQGVHPVAASIIAALRQASAAIWVG